jgi:hypothetical protein
MAQNAEMALTCTQPFSRAPTGYCLSDCAENCHYHIKSLAFRSMKCIVLKFLNIVQTNFAEFKGEMPTSNKQKGQSRKSKRKCGF